MTGWVPDELQRIAAADDLHVAPFREDDVTYGTPTWIWSVAVDGAVYVRAYNGPSSRWHRSALQQQAGRIIAAGLKREVGFEPVQGAMNDRIDGAYRDKYRGNAYLASMVGTRVRASTVRVTPRTRQQ